MLDLENSQSDRRKSDFRKKTKGVNQSKTDTNQTGWQTNPWALLTKCQCLNLKPALRKSIAVTLSNNYNETKKIYVSKITNHKQTSFNFYHKPTRSLKIRKLNRWRKFQIRKVNRRRKFRENGLSYKTMIFSVFSHYITIFHLSDETEDVTLQYDNLLVI